MRNFLTRRASPDRRFRLIFHLNDSLSFSSSSSLVPTHEHVSHLILEQKSASQALQTFKWAATLPHFTHSQSTYRALIHKLCTSRRFDTVKKLLDEMPHSLGSPPGDDIFITIIRGLGRARMIRQLIKVVDLVYRFHRKPSLKIFNSILDILVKEDIDIAREFYRKNMMGSGIEGDYYTFGILMKGLCFTNRIGECFKLLQLMKSRGIIPNTVIYNTLLFALCKNGKIGRARSLMNEMEEPNDVTYNILISGYCKEENLVQALVLLEKSFSMGFVPDVVTVTKVVEIMCNAGRVTEGVEVLERVESMGGPMDVVCYNTLIQGFCKVGKPKVGLHFLKQMENKEGRFEDGIVILELMEDSKEGSRGRISPYNSIIYGLFKQNRLNEAFEFLRMMEKLFPRAVERSLEIFRCCKERTIEDAKKVYDQMIREGGIPSILVFECLVHGFSQEGRVREAIELMNEMIANNCFPVPSIFNAIITGFCRQGKADSALKFLEDIVARGLAPDLETYAPLIDAFCKKGELQKALPLLIEMIDKAIFPDHFIWNCLLLCISQEKYFKDMNLFHLDNLLRQILGT
ncbi:hypothetical protein K1719_002188 [Acacia pycnantha]|nr:hypothetical protein K1719_002188 [Acacia pycnantha]